jgi:hypothetical protein
VKLMIALLTGFALCAGVARAQEALLPKPKLTPGRVAKSDKERAGVSLAIEQKVFARYRLPWASRAAFKIDHLIPVELGGADTIDNLWPQSLRARPYGADRKELLAEVLRLKVARGQMSLEEAQELIRNDWIDAFVDHVGMVYLRR